MKTIALIAAVAVATVAVSAASTPAFAQDQVQGRFGDAKVTYDAQKDRYCFQQTVTGSLIPAKECRSKADWADAGLTISRKFDVQLAQR